MKLRHSLLFTIATAVCLGFTACTGGNVATPSMPVPSRIPNAFDTTKSGTKRVALAFSNAPALKSGTVLPITWRGRKIGQFVAGKSHIMIAALRSRVREGAIVKVQARKIAATFILSHVGKETAVFVKVNPGRTITVVTSSGLRPSATPASGDPNGSSETEDDNGDASKIEIGQGGSLPSGLPFSVAETCATLSLTPNAGQSFSGLRFEENLTDGGGGEDATRVHGNDQGGGGSGFEYDGPFTATLDFPIIAQTSVKLELFQNDERILEIEAPIEAFGTPAATETPCPSAAPSSEPSDEPSAEPSGSPDV